MINQLLRCFHELCMLKRFRNQFFPYTHSCAKKYWILGILNVFLGHGAKKKGNVCYDWKVEKLYINCHVIFNKLCYYFKASFVVSALSIGSMPTSSIVHIHTWFFFTSMPLSSTSSGSMPDVSPVSPTTYISSYCATLDVDVSSFMSLSDTTLGISVATYASIVVYIPSYPSNYFHLTYLLYLLWTLMCLFPLYLLSLCLTPLLCLVKSPWILIS